VADLSNNQRASDRLFKDAPSQWQIFEIVNAPAADFLKMHRASGSFFKKLIAPAAEFLRIHRHSGSFLLEFVAPEADFLMIYQASGRAF
jgi:hypothetical protein